MERILIIMGGIFGLCITIGIEYNSSFALLTGIVGICSMFGVLIENSYK